MVNQRPLTERDVDVMVNNLRSYSSRIAEAIENGEKATAKWLTMCQTNLAAKIASTDIGWAPQ